eukprot:134336-Prorocentrum_lima.AAC.1
MAVAKLGAADRGTEVPRRFLKQGADKHLGKVVGEDEWAVAPQGVGGLTGLEGGVETPPSPVYRDKTDTAEARQNRLENRRERGG